MIPCSHCSTLLPSDALFCGECGRAVSSASAGGGRSGLRPLAFPVPQPEPWMNSSAGGVCAQCGLPILPDDIFCGECGFVVSSVLSVTPEPEPELEPTDPALHVLGQERFVLQFSTGEAFTVYGSGLIGRSPKPEPGEYFDHVVRILDAGRSVSKTHIEFGQEAGYFWVKDRYSGNGTVIREPDSDQIRCRPDRRYRLIRGSRVDLGDQFFIVS